jgi:hypothetical protein
MTRPLLDDDDPLSVCPWQKLQAVYALDDPVNAQGVLTPSIYHNLLRGTSVIWVVSVISLRLDALRC